MKIKLKLFLLAGLLSLNASALSQDTNLFVFLCFGQSNMEGFPGIEEQDKGPVDDRFEVLAAVDFPRMDRKNGNWYPAIPPLCRPTAGLCPADYFGRTLVSNLPPNIKVGIVNISVAASDSFNTCSGYPGITVDYDSRRNASCGSHATAISSLPFTSTTTGAINFDLSKSLVTVP